MQLLPVKITTAALLAIVPWQTAPKNAQADVLVSVRTGAVVAPDTIAAGWQRVRVEEDDAGHILVVFRLDGRITASTVPAFLTALDTTSITPAPGVALGGPEIGDTGVVVLRFTAGRYVLACVRKGDDGHRHAVSGESKVVVVPRGTVPRARAVAPVATQRVRMVDFAYTGPERWRAGEHLLHVVNDGKQDHQLRIARFRPGSPLATWMSAERPAMHVVPIAGVARMSPKMSAYLPVTLPAGEYLLHCLVSDPATNKMHQHLGMVRSIVVE